MTGADDWARRLASGAPIDEPIALVVAHPDDETLWAGAALRRLRNLTLILVTDGAPGDLAYARRKGFARREDYAACRAAELERALVALEAAPRLIRHEVRDQDAARALPAIVDRLSRDLAGATLVITHPYEGGHPDHDSCALAVRRAARAPVVEFACYARFDGTRVFGRFVPDPANPERTRPFSDEDRRRVDAALAAHVTQADVFGAWRPDAERWRAAPDYDFTRPPPGEGVLYDEFGWPLTNETWRALAAAVAR